ncbi:tripartite tricarboxylate transporter TctB family protein [Nocardiopsis terrae]
MSDGTTTPNEAAAETVRNRPRRSWTPRAGVTPEQAFRFSPRTMGAAVGLFAIGYLVLALQMPDYTAVSVPVQPSTLPRWLGVVLLVLAVLLFFQRAPVDEAAAADGTSTDGTSTDADPAQDAARLGRLADPRLEIGLFVGALVAYVALFEPLGFVLATALYLGSMTWYLGYRRHLVTATVALGLPFALYAAMTWGLGVVLPSGPLPF